MLMLYFVKLLFVLLKVTKLKGSLGPVHRLSALHDLILLWEKVQLSLLLHLSKKRASVPRRPVQFTRQCTLPCLFVFTPGRKHT